MSSVELTNNISSCENYIKKFGVDYKIVEAYGAIVKMAAQEKDENLLRITHRAKTLLEKFVYDTMGGLTMWDIEKKYFSQNVKVEILEKWYDILLIEAQNKHVDSYFRYIERKRMPNERFYEPRRKQLVKLGLMSALQGMITDKYDILCISLPPGTGKAQPMYSKVLTPKGFVEMKDIKVGSKVISGTGKVCKVLGVYPQGKKPIYELTLDDGSKCRCSDEHLWTVQNREDRQYETRTGKHRTRTIQLKDMLNNVRICSDNRVNYSLDYVEPIEFKEKEFIIHPYVMGVLIGDGNITGTPIVCNPEKEVLDKVDELLPKGYALKYKDKCEYYIRGHEGNNAKAGSLISIALKKYNLFGKKSIEKFIPHDYLTASREQRLWLLKGLMDTDGYASTTGCEYSTISETLADNVIDLVHSLGGYASKNKKRAGYKKNGVYKRCNDCFNIHIQFPAGMEEIFELTRKKEIYKPKRIKLRRYIKDITYIGEEECQCIYIDDESHLYITDNYIITHNTTLEKFFNSAVIGWFPKDYTLFYSHSGDITRMYYDGVYDIVTNSDEYTWNDIFPSLKVTSTNAKLEQFNIGKYKPFPSLQCTSVGSKNAGKVRASKFLLVDDMIGGIEEALNKSILEKLWNKYAVDARQRKVQDTDGKGCKEIHIATRWSTVDVIGRIQAMYAGNPRVKAIAVPDTDPKTGESNFDYEFGGFTKEFFADQQLLMDDISYNCLYKQEPIEREGLLYHDDELRRFSSLPLREPDAILGICDVKNKGTDFMFLPCMYQYDNDYYLVDCICDDSADYGVQYNRLTNLIIEHNMQQCEFESNNGGDRVSHEVSKRVEELGGRCNITEKATETNKETRIIVNADWVKKNVLFRDKADYKPKSDYGIMMEWLLRYSLVGKNVHDDVPDGLANFALYITKKDRKRETRVIQGYL